MSITLQTLKQPRKISKEEALKFIESVFVITPETAAYLLGYDYSEEILTDLEVDKILQDRDRKYKKEVKYAKKKKLQQPEMYSTYVDRKKIIITPAEHARDHKDNFFPELEGLSHLLKLDFIGIGLVNQLVKMYSDKETDYLQFFSLWRVIINQNESLSESFSNNEWFKIILEDKLTLGASWNQKCPVDLSIYKESFGL